MKTLAFGAAILVYLIGLSYALLLLAGVATIEQALSVLLSVAATAGIRALKFE